MFLSATTVKNVQAKLTAAKLHADTIQLEALYTWRDGTLCKYLLNGVAVVTSVAMQPGQFLHDVLADAIRWCDYYVLNDVYEGIEKDDAAEVILSVWPPVNGQVQPILKAIHNSATDTAITPAKAVVSEDALAALQAKFSRK